MVHDIVLTRTDMSNVEKCMAQDLVPTTVYGDDTRRKTY